jgi:DNA-binding IclR family transcriptional regulator
MDHRKKEKAEYLVQSVDRALDILESFNYQVGELGVTEIAPLVKASAIKLSERLGYEATTVPADQ